MIRHHPSASTLTAYAGGTLPEGLALVVATHLHTCPACRETAALVEAIGGAVLEEMPPAPMDDDSLALVLARAERPVPPAPAMVRVPGLPPPLDTVTLGPWRRIDFGLRWRPMDVRGRALAGLLEGAPGKRLPRHAHEGLELTCVLSGAFIDGDTRFMAGDVAEHEAGASHRPVIDGDQPCVCVIATEGVRLSGWRGLAQLLFAR